MAKAEWGIKRICPSCSGRYYDFMKPQPACPSCNTVYDPEALLKSRRARPVPTEVKPKKISLKVLEGLGVDVIGETVALELADETAPAADIAAVIDADEEEEPEDVSELEDPEDDLADALTLDDDE